MTNILKLPKPDKAQKQILASICSDIGKLFVAAGVVEYLIPTISDKISAHQLSLALFVALSFFGIAVQLSKEE